jgi:predicted Zn-dependent protease
MLYENGKIADSLAPYRQAAKLKSDAALIRFALGHALVEVGAYDEAIDHLEFAAHKEQKTPDIHRDLATAYGRAGDQGKAHLHLAEEALLNRKFKLAVAQANQALKLLPENGPSTLRAQDLLDLAKQEEAKEKKDKLNQ